MIRGENNVFGAIIPYQQKLTHKTTGSWMSKNRAPTPIYTDILIWYCQLCKHSQYVYTVRNINGVTTTTGIKNPDFQISEYPNLKFKNHNYLDNLNIFSIIYNLLFNC